MYRTDTAARVGQSSLAVLPLWFLVVLPASLLGKVLAGLGAFASERSDRR